MQMMIRQRGTTLIVTMIFLVIITMLGLSTIQETSLEEKMAANLRFKDMVFQQAELVLRIAEDGLRNPSQDPFGNTDGRYDENFNLSQFDSGASWGAPSWIMYSTGGIQSGYVVQEVPVLGLTDSNEAGVVQDTQKLYRITARAVSDNTAAVVVLQATFSR